MGWSENVELEILWKAEGVTCIYILVLFRQLLSKPQITYTKRAGLRVEIWTQDLPNKIKQCYQIDREIRYYSIAECAYTHYNYV
jgi:hypothetical protein